jgi:hypothetical protein
MSVRSGIAAIRAARKLVPVGDDPLAGPWRILSTSGEYSHELHLNGAGVVTCSTCRSRHGRSTCWASRRVVESLGLAPDAAPEPAPAVGSLSWLDVAREAATTTEPNNPNNHFHPRRTH